MKIEEFEKEVWALNFRVHCIVIKKTKRYAWVKPVFTDAEGRLMDAPVNTIAEKTGCKTEWAGAKGCEVRCIKVPRWPKYSFDGYVLTHLILRHMYPEFEEKQMDARNYCGEL